MVEEEVIQKRINKVLEYLNFLKEINSEYELQDFKKDRKIYGSTERFLQLCIESLIDIGNHIIADKNYGCVNDYSDIPKLLFEHNCINGDLKEVFIKIIGFRNVLVHDYLEIDRDIVYSIINDELKDIEEIIKVFSQYM